MTNATSSASPMPRWLWVALALLMLNTLWWLLTAVPLALRYPYGFDFGEGILWNQARLLTLGETLYGPIDQPPWLVENYPPLFLSLVAALSSLFPEVTPLMLGRALSMLGSLGILGLLLLLVRRETRDTPIHWLWLIPWLWLMTPPAWRWSLVMRVDTFGIALVLLALYWGTRRTGRAWWWAPLAFGAALFTKHSLVAGLVAWGIAGWIEGGAARKQRLLAFGGLGLAVLGLNLATGGGFLRHTVQYTANEFHLVRLWAGLGEYCALSWPLWGLVLLAGSGGRFQAVWADPERRPWILYLPLATLTLVTFGATGSDSNYYLEPLVALLALVIVLAAAPAPASAPLPGLSLSRGQLTGALIFAFVLTVRYGQADQFALAHQLPLSKAGGDELVALLRTSEGPVLAEDLTFTLAAGKTPDFQPYIFRLLAETGKWDEGPFVARLREGAYEYLILPVNLYVPGHAEEAGQDTLGAGFDRLTPAMEEAIRAGYRLRSDRAIFSNGSWYVYEPGP